MTATTLRAFPRAGSGPSLAIDVDDLCVGTVVRLIPRHDVQVGFDRAPRSAARRTVDVGARGHCVPRGALWLLRQVLLDEDLSILDASSTLSDGRSGRD